MNMNRNVEKKERKKERKKKILKIRESNFEKLYNKTEISMGKTNSCERIRNYSLLETSFD